MEILPSSIQATAGGQVRNDETHLAGFIMTSSIWIGKKRKAPSKSHKGKSLDASSSSGTKVGFATPSTISKEEECFYCH